MADEPTPGELSRRLDGLAMTLTHLVQRAEYAADQRATERRFVEVERDIGDVKQDIDEVKRTLAEDIKAVRQALETRAEKRASNARQALYAGILPGVFVLLGIVVQIWLAKGGG